MVRTRSQEIRREQRKSLYLREISLLVSRLAYDDAIIAQFQLTRVDFSPDGYRLTAFGTLYNGGAPIDETAQKEAFNEVLGRLILYTPSIRTSLARSLDGRYVPEIRFAYDPVKAKHDRVDDILSSLPSHSDDDGNS